MGDVSNDVNERTLDAAFSKYPSYCRSKVVRDRLSEKVCHCSVPPQPPDHVFLLQLLHAPSAGSSARLAIAIARADHLHQAKYGFIAFSDPEDFLRAWKENDGKYIGNRPIRLSKVKDDKYGSIETVTVSGRKVCRAGRFGI